MDANMAITAINIMVPKILCFLILHSPALLTDHAPEIPVDHLIRAYAYANSTVWIDRSWHDNALTIFTRKFCAKSSSHGTEVYFAGTTGSSSRDGRLALCQNVSVPTL